MQVNDVLGEARILAQQGWKQGMFWDPNGGGCLLGLIYHAAGFTDVIGTLAAQMTADPARGRLAEAAADRCSMVLGGHLYFDLAAWNDNPERRLGDILDVLTQAEDQRPPPRVELVPLYQELACA